MKSIVKVLSVRRIAMWICMAVTGVLFGLGCVRGSVLDNEYRHPSGHWKISFLGTELRWSRASMPGAEPTEVYFSSPMALMNFKEHTIGADKVNAITDDRILSDTLSAVQRSEPLKAAGSLPAPKALGGSIFIFESLSASATADHRTYLGVFRSKTLIVTMDCELVAPPPQGIGPDALAKDVQRIADSFEFLF
jgi:hypothetical protein